MMDLYLKLKTTLQSSSSESYKTEKELEGINEYYENNDNFENKNHKACLILCLIKKIC